MKQQCNIFFNFYLLFNLLVMVNSDSSAGGINRSGGGAGAAQRPRIPFLTIGSDCSRGISTKASKEDDDDDDDENDDDG